MARVSWTTDMRLLLKSLPMVLAIAVWTISMAPTSTAEKVLRPKFKAINLWNDEKFVTHNFQVDSNDPHINFTLNVLKQLQNVDVHIEASLVKKQNPEHFFNINATINLCNMLHYRMQSPLGSLVTIYLKQYGRLLETCPIQKGNYYLHKFWIPEDTALVNFSELDFVFLLTATHVDAMNKKTVIINDNYSGEMVIQDVKNFKPGFLTLLGKAG